MVKSADWLSGLVADSHTIILITDDQFNIRFASSTVESILGYSPVTVVGKSIFQFVPAPFDVEWRNSLLRAGYTTRTTIRLASRDGQTLFFNVSVTNQVAHQEIQGLVILLTDITGERRKRDELRRQNEQLDQFIFKITHDLRTPLNSAKGLLHLLESTDGDERQHYLQLMRKTFDRLQTFIDEVSTFYQVDRLAVVSKSVNLKKLLEEELEFQATQAFPALKRSLLYQGTETIQGDLFRLKTIVGNLFSNAIKYADRSKPESFIRVSVQALSEGVTLTVEDNGIGIAKEHQNKIFDEFFRATTTASGSGLGLAIVRDTVERLGGTISVKSEVGKGTTFIVQLPAPSSVQSPSPVPVVQREN